MAAEIIDGKKISETIREELKNEIEKLKQEQGITPGLAVVIAGDNPASLVYVRNKNNACRKIGIYSEQHNFPGDITEAELLDLIQTLNSDPKIDGILVQLPLPGHIDENRVLNTILPAKDVDGFHPVNMGKLFIGSPGFKPCTPYGIQKMLARSGISTEGMHVVVLGRSNIVGKPAAGIFMQKEKEANATVTICHSRTRDLPAITRQADILIAAIGIPEFVTGDMVNPGAVVIDVGINRVDDPHSDTGYRITGDVEFASVSAKCRAISPVPGGVGPMTIAMLLYNTVQAARQRAGK